MPGTNGSQYVHFSARLRFFIPSGPTHHHVTVGRDGFFLSVNTEAIMRWYVNETVELGLHRLGIQFEFKKIPVSKIKRRQSLGNNARMGGESIDGDHVFNLALAMVEDDAAFPAIVVIKDGTGYLVCDGNHRIAAAEEADVLNGRLDAYVLQTDDKFQADLATRLFNRMNGAGQSKQESINHVIQLAARYPDVEIKELSELWGIKVDAVYRAIHIQEVVEQLQGKHVNARELSKTHLLELSRIKGNEHVLVRAAHMVTDYSLTHNQLREILTDVKRARTEKTQLERLDDAETTLRAINSRHREPQRGKRDRKIQERFRRIMASLMQLMRNYPTREHLQLTARGDLEEFKLDWTNVRRMVDTALNEQ